MSFFFFSSLLSSSFAWTPKQEKELLLEEVHVPWLENLSSFSTTWMSGTHRLAKMHSLCFIGRAVVSLSLRVFFPPAAARGGDYVWKQLELHLLADGHFSVLFAHCQVRPLLTVYADWN